MKKQLNLLILLIICLHPKANNNIYFHHIGLENGLSQINIMSIYQDEFGTLWFGTTEGINRYNGKNIQTFSSVPFNQRTIYSITGDKKGHIYYIGDQDLYRINLETQQFDKLLESNVKSIFFKQNKLWVICADQLLTFDQEKNKFIKIKDLNWNNYSSLFVTEDAIWIGSHDDGLFSISLKSSQMKEWLTEPVYCIYEDSRNNIWVGSYNNGVYKIELKNNSITNYSSSDNKNSISNNHTRCILEDNTGDIWVGTFYGLNRFDPQTNQWTTFVHNEYTSHDITHSSIFALLQDQQGTIWVGTYFGGVNYFNLEQNIFKYYEASNIDKNYLSYSYVGKMVEDKYNHLWICTEGGGLNCMDLETRKISRYLSENKNYNNQKCIWYNQKNDQLYIGTFNGGLLIFDIKTKKSRRLLHDPNDPQSLPHNTINQIQYIEKKNALYLSTSKGVVIMDLESEKILGFNDPRIENHMKSLFHIDKYENAWLYLNCVVKLNLKTAERVEYTTKINATINDIVENDNGDIFFATGGAGIFWYDSKIDSVKHFSTNNGLISNYCYAILQEPQGNLIILHNKGFSFFDYHQPENILYHSSDNFPLKGFNKGNSVYIAKNGEIFLGGINGLVSFYKKDLNVKEKKYVIYFDKLFVNSELVSPTGGNFKILDKSLQYCSGVKLNAKQNNFSIEFASSNYHQDIAIQYEYRLKGFDKKWICTNTQTATYMNIDPGNYTFQVRQAALGAKNTNPIYELKIRVEPPFYLSTVAIVLYIIIIITLLIVSARLFMWRMRMQSNLEFERKENERIQELNQIKLRFFTNISHEFRTPLTLISGQVESLMLIGADNKIRKKIGHIRRNVEHLQNLITELLDFRKQEQGFVKLNVKQTDYIAFVKTIYESFSELAKKRGISFKFDYPDEEILVFIDPKQIQKVIYNLLSNAFKYTESGGEVRIQVTKNNNTVQTKTSDNGIGIPSEALSKIFDRFYQIEYRSSGLTLGTGIGLALAKEIVTAHKGEISAASEINKGAEFTFSLLLGSSHFTDEELRYKESLSVTMPENISQFMDTDEFKIKMDVEGSAVSSDKPSILLVDDNEELLYLLKESFSPLYNVITATNGEDALKITINEQPDIIVSDAMMHKMTGKELCYKVKNNINTSHIPFVLLTSQTEEDQIVEGFMHGVDAYITKPFSIKVLISQCNTLLKNRNLLFNLHNKQSATHVQSKYTTENDKKLIEKVEQIIQDNLSNPEFDMNSLSTELGFSRSKFYASIKSITGLTPNEFTLNIKMKEAVNLLENKPEMNISDIAFYLGFSSAKYFTKIFKSIYGIVPKEWNKEKRHNNNNSMN